MIGNLHGHDHNYHKTILLMRIDSNPNKSWDSVEEFHSIIWNILRSTFLGPTVFEQQLTDELSWFYESIEGELD